MRAEARAAGQAPANSATGRVRSVVFQGSRSLVEVETAAGPLLTEFSGQDAADLSPDSAIRLGWPVSETMAFPAPEAA